MTDVGGQAHQQTFWVMCEVAALNVRESGSGSSRRAAEQDAASKVLEQLLALETRQPTGARMAAGAKTRKVATTPQRAASGSAPKA